MADEGRSFEARSPLGEGDGMGGFTPGGAEPLVFDLSFRVRTGARDLVVELSSAARAVAVFGPSGGGKSTLLRTLAGVDRRATGVVRIRGAAWLDSGVGVFLPPWERGVGWVPQDHLLFPHLSVRENLGFGGASDEEVGSMALRLQVEGLLDRRPRRLSGGEQQRVALGRALLSNPRLLLLDEPFSALDRPLRSRMVALLRDHVQTTGTSLVLVSHDEADAVSLGQEHWLLSQGRLERVE